MLGSFCAVFDAESNVRGPVHVGGGQAAQLRVGLLEKTKNPCGAHFAPFSRLMHLEGVPSGP